MKQVKQVALYYSQTRSPTGGAGLLISGSYSKGGDHGTAGKRQESGESTRVSSESQALEESVSLAEQTRDIEAYAEERGYTIIQRYQDVESGVSRIRPGFQRLQAEAKAFAFDIIIAWKSDRLARSGSAMGDLLDAVGRRVCVETVRETFNLQTAELMASIARMERENFVARSLMGKKGAARAGRKIPAGRPLYGYRKDAEGRPVVDEHEAAVVCNGCSICTSRESASGFPPSRRPWTARVRVQADCGGRSTWMLRNETYAGRGWSYDGVEIPCPAIVDRATWDEGAEASLTKKTVTASRGNTKTDYLLQGIVSCEGCGRILSARTRRETNGRTLRYYRCRGYTKSCRPRPYIRADAAGGEEFWRHVSDLLRSPARSGHRSASPDPTMATRWRRI